MFDPAQGYPNVVPYRRYVDPAAALRWHEAVLDATEVLRMTIPDGRIGHAELTIGRSVIALGLAVTPAPEHADPVTCQTLRSMTLVFVTDVDEAVRRVAEHGGSIIDPPADQPWGLRQAVIADPEGYVWEPSVHLRDVPPESWGATVRPGPFAWVTRAGTRWRAASSGTTTSSTARSGPMCCTRISPSTCPRHPRRSSTSVAVPAISPSRWPAPGTGSPSSTRPR